MADWKVWRDYLWPAGGTLLGLIAIPVAIAQYPDFFNENAWLLPISVGIVVLCWVLPLLLHDRVRRIYRAVIGIKRWGMALFVVLCLAALCCLYFGGNKLLKFHN